MSLSEKNDGNPTSELEQNLEFLRQTYFFSGLPLEALKVFAYLCTREKFKQGEYLFQQDDDDGQAFYIIEGKANLEREQHAKIHVIRECNSGEFIGGLTLMGDMRRLFSLKATTDISCLIINREKFARTMEQFQGVMPKIFKALVNRIDSWEDHFLINRTDKCLECLRDLGVSLL
jgi:CRP-like cAMP-binding protein